MTRITKTIGRQVFDSRGNPTIEAEVFSKNISAKAICPSGASTGTYEAYEKRDLNNKKYLGRSVYKAIDLINKKISKKFDVIICMYHDQATIPIKTLDFENGVNVTLGLPIIRTSPDHGTALDIAGKGVASEKSLYASIKMSQYIAKKRKLWIQ